MKHDETDFAGMNVQELRALILDADNSLQKRDEAMYYVLNEKLTQGLKRKFEPYRNQLEENFEDVLLEFFLYLRGDDVIPYKKLLHISSDASFEGWLVISFRNFTGKRAAISKRIPKSSAKPDCIELQNVESISPDRLINMLSTLVAYCCQELNPTSRFIFLRMLLTILDKSRSLPDREVAASLGITDIHYRVISFRLRSKILKIKGMLLDGHQPVLTAESRRLADTLDSDFSNWYQKIAACYENALTSLPQSKSIGALRADYMSQDAGMLYDSASSANGNNTTYGYGYSYPAGPPAVWNALGAPETWDVCILREPLA